MKKSGLIILILIMGIFTSFLSGFFIGRNFNHEQVVLSAVSPERSLQDSVYEGPHSELTGIRININHASLEELKILPGIGDVLGQAILDYRFANGPFSSTNDLLLVKGISQKRFDTIKDFIKVS